MIWLILLNVLAQIADFATTYLVLSSGGVELNPFSAAIIDKTSIYVWGALKLAVVGFWLQSTYKKPWFTIAAVGSALPFFGAAIWNWSLL
jgi:hypothetical protein